MEEAPMVNDCWDRRRGEGRGVDGGVCGNGGER